MRKFLCPTSTVPENCEEAQKGCHTLTFKIKAVPVPDRTKTGNLCIHLLFFLDVVHLFRCDGELPLQPVHERAGDQSEGSHQHGHIQVGGAVLRSWSIFDRLRVFFGPAPALVKKYLCFKKTKKDEQQYILQ